MAIASRHKPQEKKFFGFCPIWQTGETNSSNNNNHTSSASSTQNLHNSSAYHNRSYGNNSRADGDHPGQSSSTSVSSVARSLLPARRRLRLDPSNKLYFPWPIRHHHCPIPYDEPGKQVRSAIRLKNTSKSHVAFKFQTTAPKSCYMRPPGGILAPGESIIATVFKFVEHPDNNEKQSDQKTRVKFKIMSLKVKGGTDYVPELFDEQKEWVTMERILRVVFLDMERPSPAMEKLKRHLAEAEAAVEARKKPPAAETGPPVVGDGLVIDEWKERREKYLARQQVEAVGSG